MKILSLIFVLLFTTLLTAQESEILNEIEALKTKIELSEKGEKLKFMDSLSDLVKYKPTFYYDSIVKETINYALHLDSLNMAAILTADLIYYKNNRAYKPEEGLQIFKNFTDKKLHIKSNEALGQLYLNGADSYYFMNDFESALKNYNKAKKFAKKLESNYLLGLVNLYMGYTYSDMGAFPEASIELQDAEKEFQKLKDTFNIIAAKNSMAILYSLNAFYEVAEQEREEAIVLAEKINGYRNLASLYANQAEDYRNLEKWEKGIASLLLALEFNEKSKTDFYMRPILICKLIVAYAEKGSLKEIEKYKKEIESNIGLYTNNANNDNYLEALKNIAFVKGNYKKSLALGKEHLALKIKAKKPDEIQLSEKFLSKVYKALGNNEKENLHLNNYYAIKDSISSVQKVKSLAYYQTLYETEIKDSKIKEQTENIRLLDAEHKVKNQWLIFTSTGLLSLFGFILLFKSRNEIKRRQKSQESFSQNLIIAQENERTRVAREIHDSVGQKLMLLTKKIKMVENSDLAKLSENTLEELRAISRGLYPPMIEGLGLTIAIESMINEVDAHTNLFFTNDIENIDNLLNKEDALHVYRIIQEVLNNIVKHAKAKAVFVMVGKNKNHIKLSIEDNGNGFDFSKEFNENLSLGMKTLKERAKIIKSKLEIKSQHQKGTVVQLEIPI